MFHCLRAVEQQPLTLREEQNYKAEGFIRGKINDHRNHSCKHSVIYLFI